MKDYYKILGVKETATEEEIRKKWVSLTRRYHPDVSKNKNLDDKIKEINEAYQTIKFSSTRLEYDIRRDYYLQKKRPRLSRILLPASLFILLAFGLILIPKSFLPVGPGGPTILVPESSPKEAPIQADQRKIEGRDLLVESRDESQRNNLPKEESASPGSVPPGKGTTRDILREARPLLERTSPQTALKVDKKSLLSPVPRDKAAPVGKVTPKEVLFPPAISKATVEEKTEKIAFQEAQKDASKESAPVAPAPIPPSKPAPAIPVVNQMSPIRPEEPKTIAVSATPSPVVKAAPAPVESHSALTSEEEVKRFFKDYVDYYRQKNITRFLALFSSKALQNRTNDRKEMSKIYSDFFDQSQEILYRMEEMKIEISEKVATVKALYQLDQISKRRAERKTWRGNISWILVKENGSLKILFLDYQPNKS